MAAVAAGVAAATMAARVDVAAVVAVVAVATMAAGMAVVAAEKSEAE